MAKIAVSPIVIDTSLLVDFLRGTEAAADYLEGKRGQFDLVCTFTTAAELIVGSRSRAERKAIEQLLRRFRLEPITDDDSTRALNWLKKYHHSHGIGFHDCLIAATALRIKAWVVTLNDKHFRCLPNVTIMRPY